MTEKFKKIDRQYVLSDSSVNVYGFRLLTSGYQLDAYRRNPIGYYMHNREEGIALKWDDLRIEDDKVVGTPVINLSNQRGLQTCAEVENGFLNAASVGHIVVLEYSNDPELMLPGQTGPTITKWYNKECSLVDIPGNTNALTTLYDAQENVLNLCDMSGANPLVALPDSGAWQGLKTTLQLAATSNNTDVLVAVNALSAQATQLAAHNQQLHEANTQLQQQLTAFTELRTKAQVDGLLQQALADKRITVQLKDRLAADYTSNPEGLKELLAAIPVYRSLTAELQQATGSEEAQWQWDDYERNDPSGKKLQHLRANDAPRYKELFDKKFATV